MYTFLKGDSGGALVSKTEDDKYVIVGIVSWGLPACGAEGSPDVFTKVSFFVDWIKKTMKNN